MSILWRKQVVLAQVYPDGARWSRQQTRVAHTGTLTHRAPRDPCWESLSYVAPILPSNFLFL